MYTMLLRMHQFHLQLGLRRLLNRVAASLSDDVRARFRCNLLCKPRGPLCGVTLLHRRAQEVRSKNSLSVITLALANPEVGKRFFPSTYRTP